MNKGKGKFKTRAKLNSTFFKNNNNDNILFYTQYFTKHTTLIEGENYNLKSESHLPLSMGANGDKIGYYESLKAIIVSYRLKGIIHRL